MYQQLLYLSCVVVRLGGLAVGWILARADGRGKWDQIEFIETVAARSVLFISVTKQYGKGSHIRVRLVGLTSFQPPLPIWWCVARTIAFIVGHHFEKYVVQSPYKGRMKLISEKHSVIVEKLEQIQEDMGRCLSLLDTNSASATVLLNCADTLPYNRKQLWPDCCPDLESLIIRKAVDLVGPLIIASYNETFRSAAGDSYDTILNDFLYLFKKLTEVMPREDNVYNIAEKLMAQSETVGMKATFAAVMNVLEAVVNLDQKTLQDVQTALVQLAAAEAYPQDLQDAAFKTWCFIVQSLDQEPLAVTMELAVICLDSLQRLLPVDKKDSCRIVAGLCRCACVLNEAVKTLKALGQDPVDVIKHPDFDKYKDELLRSVQRYVSSSKQQVPEGSLPKSTFENFNRIEQESKDYQKVLGESAVSTIRDLFWMSWVGWCLIQCAV